MARLNLAKGVATLICLSALVPQALGEDPVTTIPLYGYDKMPGLDGSILAVEDHVTTMSLQCLPGSDQNQCGLGPQQTLTIGPNTYNMYVGGGSDFTATQQCIRRGSTEAVCHQSIGGPQANSPGSSTATYTGSGIGYIAVTVTSGADKLGGEVGTTTNTASTAASTKQSTSTGAEITTTAASTAPLGISASSSPTESAATTYSKNTATIVQYRQSTFIISLASFFGALLA